MQVSRTYDVSRAIRSWRYFLGHFVVTNFHFVRFTMWTFGIQTWLFFLFIINAVAGLSLIGVVVSRDSVSRLWGKHLEDYRKLWAMYRRTFLVKTKFARNPQ